MNNALVDNLKKLLIKSKIQDEHITLINETVLNELYDIPTLNKSLENYIAILVEKYDINYFEIYKLNQQIWAEIINYKFNTRKLMVSFKCKKEKKLLIQDL
jgi:hypothetical protein